MREIIEGHSEKEKGLEEKDVVEVGSSVRPACEVAQEFVSDIVCRCCVKTRFVKG